MKNKFEFRLDGLDAFRSALSRGVRTPLQKGRVIHGWALQMGAWLGKKYAPLPNSRRPGLLQHLEQPGRALPLLHDVLQSRRGGEQLPSYLWKPNQLESKNHYIQLAREVSANFEMPAVVKHKVLSYPGMMFERARSQGIKENGVKSFAPPPAIDRSAKNGLLKMPTQVHAPVRKRVSQTQKNEVSLPLTGVGGSAAESHTKQGGVLTSRSDEPRLAAGFSASGWGEASAADFDDALEEYFFRQSRLAPSGGTAFNPRLSPFWAGLKLPV